MSVFTRPAIFRASLALNAMLCLVFVSKRVYFANRPASVGSAPVNDSIVTYSYNKIKTDNLTYDFFKLLPNATSDIVFVGTSLTQAFPLQEVFLNVHLRNRGIGGNTTSDILKRIDEVAEGHPSKVFIEAGINDVTKELTIDTILGNIRNIVCQIRLNSPETMIHITSVFPVADKKYIPKIISLNKSLISFCEKEKIDYIDVFPHLAVDGKINPALTTDGVHLNGKGYFIWKSVVEKYL